MTTGKNIEAYGTQLDQSDKNVVHLEYLSEQLSLRISFSTTNKNVKSKSFYLASTAGNGQTTYSVDLPAAENKSAQCRPSVFLATLTTTSTYSGKFLIKVHVCSNNEELVFLGAGGWFLLTLCL